MIFENASLKQYYDLQVNNNSLKYKMYETLKLLKTICYYFPLW